MLRPGPLFHPLPLALILAVAATVPRPHAAGAVVINELMSSNGATRADETGGYPDWFELFNPGTEAVDLTGWGVSDDVARPFKWTIRHGGLDAGGYLVVFASGKDRQPDAVAPLAPDALPGLALWLRAESVDPTAASACDQELARVDRVSAQAESAAPIAASASVPVWAQVDRALARAE